MMGIGCENRMSYLVTFHKLSGCWTSVQVTVTFIIVGMLILTECKVITEQSSVKRRLT
jgi:hypothetical protein